MKKERTTPRKGWQDIIVSLGLSYHIDHDGLYWNEQSCYIFDETEILAIESATLELHDLCLAAVDHVIRNDRFAELGIPFKLIPLILRSWEREDRPLLGRFDLAYDGKNPPKMLEYNADGALSLLESSIIQWNWLEDVFPGKIQFNTLHEKLLDRWRQMALPGSRIYISSFDGNTEDYCDAEYIYDVVQQAGLDPRYIHIGDIGWSAPDCEFVDLDGEPIGLLYKIYPWEWLIEDDFGPFLSEETMSVIEPAWKAVVSSKGILPVLWELFPNHPNLLPAYFSPEKVGNNYARKPLWSREGANMEIVTEQGTFSTPGEYGKEGYVYQEYCALPEFDGMHPIIGSWMIGHEACGMGIREDASPVIKRTSVFVPHYFV